MRLRRTVCFSVFLFLAVALCVPIDAAAATQEFYVDFNRTVSGDGSAASPWKARSDINWTAVSQALQSQPVVIYFSSRSSWTDDQELRIKATGSASFPLTLDGQSRYNAAATGTAVWSAETTPANRATLTNAGGTGGTVYVGNDTSFVSIRGFSLVKPTWGGIILGDTNPTTNVHDILVENNVIDSPPNLQGVWLGYGETGCYNITVRGNTIMRTPLESIYMGHYSYLADTITGVVVERNTIIDSGVSGEGDIDIKAGCYGAIVRYNQHYDTTVGHVLAGVVMQASAMQVYGNELYSLVPHDVSDGGSGIQINADGANGVGKPLANLLVYNNVIDGNTQAGITVHADLASITNAKILNNTIVGNGTTGLKATASGGYSITISELENNVFSSNTAYEIDLSSGVTVTTADHNDIYHPAGGSYLRYSGTDQTYAQWQALGFEANGLSVDPQLSTAFRPNSATSPLVGKAAVLTEFTLDKSECIRGTAWDIGAYEYDIVPRPPSALRIIGG